MHFSPPGEISRTLKVKLHCTVEVCVGEDRSGRNSKYLKKVKKQE